MDENSTIPALRRYAAPPRLTESGLQPAFPTCYNRQEYERKCPMEKLKALLTKYREQLLYLFFGGVTR